jgi:hypothetical protein
MRVGGLGNMLARPGRHLRTSAGEDLAVLIRTWGDTYFIGFADGAWRAVHVDSGAMLPPARTLDGLTAAIRADWAATGSVS